MVSPSLLIKLLAISSITLERQNNHNKLAELRIFRGIRKYDQNIPK